MIDIKKWHKDRMDEVLYEHKYGIMLGLYAVGFSIWLFHIAVTRSSDWSGYFISGCCSVYGICYTIRETAQYIRTKKRRSRRCSADELQ